MEKNRRILVLGIVFLFCFGHLCAGALEQPPAPSVSMVVPYYPLPERMELCGEPVPMQDMDVRERFDREFTIVIYNHAQVFLWLKRKDRFFPYIEKQLTLNKLPDDLKYVAVAESDLLLSAASPAGAKGPWQFIASTGSVYGLAQSSQIDERHDFEAATSSAFKYLQDLHGIFQNWTLAIAAYNCGEKRVQEEMKRQKVDNYYSLKLPQETERYVFRILAIKEVLSHPERYGYSLPKGAGYPAVPVERVSVNLPASVPVQMLAEAAGVTYRDFKLLNPALISDSVPGGLLNLKVPAGRGKLFQDRVQVCAVNYKPNPVYHKVRRGETLSGIASRYKVSTQSLREWNNIKGNTVRPGQEIKIIR